MVKKKALKICVGIGIAAITAMIIACIVWIAACEQRASPDPAPNTLETVDADDGFPSVDWDYWLSVNPDVIGWVTVPNTNIAQPIVQAHADNPTYYLKHDVYGEYNPMGVPYLDAGCYGDLTSENAIVFGHHWSGGRVFSDFSNFADETYAKDHSTILLQTPTTKRRLNVDAVEITRGSAPTKVTDFESHAEFEVWYQQRFDAASIKLGEEPIGSACPDRVVTFCTCSYAHKNDRTLVYAADVQSF